MSNSFPLQLEIAGTPTDLWRIRLQQIPIFLRMFSPNSIPKVFLQGAAIVAGSVGKFEGGNPDISDRTAESVLHAFLILMEIPPGRDARTLGMVLGPRPHIIEVAAPLTSALRPVLGSWSVYLHAQLGIGAQNGRIMLCDDARGLRPEGFREKPARLVLVKLARHRPTLHTRDEGTDHRGPLHCYARDGYQMRNA